MKRFTNLSVATCLSVFLVGGGLAAVDGCRRCFAPNDRLAAQQMQQWDCRDVVQRLHEAGLDYRPVSPSSNGPWEYRVFLTKTDKRWLDLNDQMRVTEQIDRWQGTVYCERVGAPELQREQLALWGEYGLEVGPFLFFGDPTMLAEIAGGATGARAQLRVPHGNKMACCL